MAERKGHAYLTIHLDLDHQAVKSCIEEDVKTLADLVELAVEHLRTEVQNREEFRLDETQSYDIKFRLEMWDAAKGIEPEAVNTKMDLLFNDD